MPRTITILAFLTSLAAAPCRGELISSVRTTYPVVQTVSGVMSLALNGEDQFVSNTFPVAASHLQIWYSAGDQAAAVFDRLSDDIEDNVTLRFINHEINLTDRQWFGQDLHAWTIQSFQVEWQPLSFSQGIADFSLFGYRPLVPFQLPDAPFPEPPAAISLLIGLACLGGVRRSRLSC